MSAMGVWRRFCHALFLITILEAALLVPTSIAQEPVDGALAEARLAYDATDYEHARELLDSVISQFGTPTSPERRQFLATAYELRARTRLNLRDIDAARTDFRALLLIDPAYLLSAQVGPRVLQLFEEVKGTTIGTVSIDVEPADASVILDGASLATQAAAVSLVAGTHTISASRTGYATTTQTFTVIPGAPPQRVAFALERVSSSVAVVTSPANIEVVVDGVSRGVTELDPDAKGEAGASLSKRFVVPDLQNGRHRLEFRRECYVRAEQEVDVARPNDYRLETVKLAPAVATVSVGSDASGATVFVDEVPKGAAPLVLSDICQGQHVLEVRTAFGRDLRRMDLKTGQQESFQARVRPAFAIISDSGAAGDVRGGPDLRLLAESAFLDARAITFFAPPEKRAAELMAADQLPIDWLAFDVLRRPIGKASTIGERARAEIGARIAKALSAQGLAAVTRDPGGDPGDMLLVLLAPGSAEPDVLRWKLNDQGSVRDAIRQLEQPQPLYRASIGALAVDVQEVDGAVVAAVDTGSSAESGGLRPGDTIVAAGGTPVTSVVQLLASIDARKAGEQLQLDVRDGAGMTRAALVTVQAIPLVVSLADQALLTNALVAGYVFRAATLSDALEEVAVRLNIAALYIRLRDRADARRESERVVQIISGAKAPSSAGDALTGTAHYLLGLAAELDGDTAAADRAWRVAAQSSGSFLSEGGEPLKDLAEQRLNQLLVNRGRP